MSDLISRSALLEDLKKWKGLDDKTIEAVIDTINNQPTAYDVEKVAGDIQKASTITGMSENHIKCVIDEALAIYIVKKGGI